MQPQRDSKTYKTSPLRLGFAASQSASQLPSRLPSTQNLKFKNDLRTQIAIKEAELARMIANASQIAKRVHVVNEPSRLSHAKLASHIAASRISGEKAVDRRSSREVKSTNQKVVGSTYRQRNEDNQGFSFSHHTLPEQMRSSQVLPSTSNFYGYQKKVQRVSPLRLLAHDSKAVAATRSHQQLQPQYQSSSPLRASRSPPLTDQNQRMVPERDTRPDYPEKDSNRLVIQPIKVSMSTQQLDRERSNSNLRLKVPVYNRDTYLDKINGLNQDIVEFRRKLDVARIDLARIQQEKAELEKQLNAQNRNSIDLRHQLTDEQESETQNIKNLIQVEKKENEKLHERIITIKTQQKEAQNGIESSQNAVVHNDQIQNRLSVEITHRSQEIQVLQHQLASDKQEMTQIMVKISELASQEKTFKLEIDGLEAQRKIKATDRQRLVNEFAETSNHVQREEAQIHGEMQRLQIAKNFCNKQIVAKITCQILEMCSHNLRQSAFDEIRNFSYFDSNTNRKLKNLLLVLYKVSCKHKKQGLYLWYRNCLKPFMQIHQNQDLSSKFYVHKFLSKTFHAWRCQFNRRMDIYKSKTDSIQLIWLKLQNYSKEEQKRAIHIWKQKTCFNNLKARKVKFLILKSYKQKLSLSMLRWKAHSYRVITECKIMILKREYAQKFYLNTLFQALKENAFLKVRTKQRLMARYLKLWKDYLSYKRYLVDANVAMFKFKKANLQYTLQVCFDALKANKEAKKMTIMTLALKGDVDVAIQHFNSQNEALVKRIDRSNVTRKMEVIKMWQGRRLYSYWTRWLENTRQAKSHLSTKFKDLIFRFYRQKLQFAFLHWRQQKSLKKIKQRKQLIVEMNNEIQSMENDQIKQSQNFRTQAEAVSSVQSKQNNKVLKRMLKRMHQQALDRWKDQVKRKNHVGQINEAILTKLKKRLLSQAWETYKRCYLKAKKLENKKGYASQMELNIKTNLLRKVLNAWCAFTLNQFRAKKYWGRILGRINCWMQRSALRRWRTNGNEFYIYQLRLKQSQAALDYEEKSRNLNSNDIGMGETEAYVDELSCQLKRKGHKQLGNYLIRMYSDTLARRFRFWKHNYSKQGIKEKILKRTIEHWRKHQMVLVRAAFKTFITLEIQQQKKAAIKSVMLECESQQGHIQNDDIRIAKIRKKMDEKSQTLTALSNFKRKRLEKNLDIISRRNVQLLYMSKKRRAFEALRKRGKQERKFVDILVKVLNHAVLTISLTNLKQGAREVIEDRKMYKVLNQLILKFLKTNIGEYFSFWKDGARRKVNQAYKTDKAAYEETVSYFAGKIKQVKTQNTGNVAHFWSKRYLKRLYRAWVLECKKLKKLRQHTEDKVQVSAAIIHKQCIQRWYLRTQRTLKIKFNLQVMKANYRQRMLRAVCQAIRKRRQITRHLVESICNLESMLLDKHKIEGFKIMCNFTSTKKDVSKKFKELAKQSILSYLTQRHIEISKRYFSLYRMKVKEANNKKKVCLRIVLKIQNANLRWAHEHWRNICFKQVLRQELNEVGPVTEYLFEANRTIRNLQNFMKHEHYTKEEILAWTQGADNKNNYLMMRLYKRMKIPKQNRYLQRCFDQWTFWCKVKKQMKYVLNYCNATVTPVKSELRWAFDKWKRSDFIASTVMATKSFKRLQAQNIKDTEHLARLAEEEAQNQSIISHVTKQRNKLLELNVSSKRLALSLFHDNYIKDLRIAINRWKDLRHHGTLRDGAILMEQKVNLMTDLKGRTAEIDQDNSVLNEENEQLRQFSIEGFAIAKTVQDLSRDREIAMGEMQKFNSKIRELESMKEKLLKAIAECERKPRNPKSKFLNQTFIKMTDGQEGGMKTFEYSLDEFKNR